MSETPSTTTGQNPKTYPVKKGTRYLTTERERLEEPKATTLLGRQALSGGVVPTRQPPREPKNTNVQPREGRKLLPT